MIQCIKMGIVGLIMRIKYFFFVSLLSVCSSFFVNYYCIADTQNSASLPIRPVVDQALVEFVDNGFFAISETSKDKIVSKLGVADKIFQKKISNPYYDELDTRYSFYYPGLVLNFVELSAHAGGGVLFESIIVSSSKWTFKPLAMGMTSKEIMKIFPGNYRWVNASTLKYEVGSYTPNVVLLYFVKNSLVKIEWKFYSG